MPAYYVTIFAVFLLTPEELSILDMSLKYIYILHLLSVCGR